MFSVLRWYIRQEIQKRGVAEAKKLFRMLFEEVHKELVRQNASSSVEDTEQAIRVQLAQIKSELRRPENAGQLDQ